MIETALQFRDGYPIKDNTVAGALRYGHSHTAARGRGISKTKSVLAVVDMREPVFGGTFYIHSASSSFFVAKKEDSEEFTGGASWILRVFAQGELCKFAGLRTTNYWPY